MLNIEHPIVQALLTVAMDLEIHHGLVFEYADGSLADEEQRLDFERSHEAIRQVLTHLAPHFVQELHPLPVRGPKFRMLAAPFSADGFPLPQSGPGA